MCPSSRQNLVNIVNKVSRYQEAARLLYRTAKKSTILRRAKVLLVNLPKEVFARFSDTNHDPELPSMISRTSTFSQGSNLGYLCRLLKKTKHQLNEQFAAQRRDTLRTAKIHARVQMIFQYELNVSRLPPRVVCSSKDACFLCNAFILMHGKMHMPRYHGRLYPGWRLPLMHNLNDLDLRLNSVLEDQIRASLKTLTLRQERKIYPDPNESTQLTLPISASTLGTSSVAEAPNREISSPNTPLTNDTPRPWECSTQLKYRASLSSPYDLCSGSAVKTEEDGDPKKVSQDEGEMQFSSPYSSPKGHDISSKNGVAELIQGVPKVSRTDLSYDIQCYTAGAL